MTSELKPCPFCGSADLELVHAAAPYVLCAGCGAEGPWEETYPGDLEAAKRQWNHRASPPPSPLVSEPVELVEALKPFKYWLDHIGATGSRRLDDDEYVCVSGAPKMGQLRQLCSLATLPTNTERQG